MTWLITFEINSFVSNEVGGIREMSVSTFKETVFTGINPQQWMDECEAKRDRWAAEQRPVIIFAMQLPEEKQ